MDLKEPGVDSGKEGLLIPVDSEVRKFFFNGSRLWCEPNHFRTESGLHRKVCFDGYLFHL